MGPLCSHAKFYPAVPCQTAWGGQLPSLPKVSAFCSGTITPPTFYFSWFKNKILVSLQGRENRVSPVQSVTKVTRKLLQCNQKG